ncbi:MAG: preprotein translocase subunit SecG [Candidatus Omnitrophica bacterium]|nr:preprotein translocase subunit SecG [Candidatus Omnitrophota bacterium]
MITFLTIVHIIACILLVATILMQSGKGGGLAEGFSSAENLLGAQTNVVMVRVTTFIGVIFLVTCLSLAVLTAKQGTSLMKKIPARTPKAKTVDVDKLFDQAPSQTITLNAEGPAGEAAAVPAEKSAAPVSPGVLVNTTK